jgi:hypothetical protein
MIVLENIGYQDNGMIAIPIIQNRAKYNYVFFLSSRVALEIGSKHFEDRRLRVFENRVQRRIFGFKRVEVHWSEENYIRGV